jgi:hypothetical protein
MEASLREFKEKFYNALLDIHWKQWVALGVASHVRPEKTWIIDLEPLVVSTLAIGLQDKPFILIDGVAVKKGEWINLSRLKRIVRVFLERSPGLKEPALLPEILGYSLIPIIRMRVIKSNLGNTILMDFERI